jgi:hypothetical protein
VVLSELIVSAISATKAQPSLESTPTIWASVSQCLCGACIPAGLVPQPRSVEATLCKRPRLHEQQEGKQLSHGRNLSSLIGTISVEIIAFYFRLSLTCLRQLRSRLPCLGALLAASWTILSEYLLREIHAAQQGLEARLGTQGIPGPIHLQKAEPLVVLFIPFLYPCECLVFIAEA